MSDVAPKNSGYLEVSVGDLGAFGDGETDDTDAFKSAIDAIRSHGGGRLIVSGSGAGGGHFRIRPINLTSHMVLFLDRDVTVSAISDQNLWPVIPALPSYGQGRDHPGPRYTSLLHGEHLVNVTIQGVDAMSSVLDGRGHYWWKLRADGLDKFTRGHLVEFMYSRDIRMYNFHMRNSPFWTNHFFDCDHVHIKNVHVYAPESGAPNTDGWNPDSSSNVLIEDSVYHGGDDCVAIKAGWDCFGIDYNKPTVNVTIRNLSCFGHSAAVSIGSEMSGGVENVTVQNVTYMLANHVAKIKVGNTRGGFVRDIVYRNISAVGDLKSAIHVDMFHFFNKPNPSCPQNFRPHKPTEISNLHFEGINGLEANILSNNTFHFVGMKDHPIRNVSLRDIYFPVQNSLGSKPWNCSSVTGRVHDRSVQPWPPCREFDILSTSQDEKTFAHQLTLLPRREYALCWTFAMVIGLFAMLTFRCKEKTTNKQKEKQDVDPTV